jgi:hypothetical protein
LQLIIPRLRSTKRHHELRVGAGLVKPESKLMPISFADPVDA